MAGETGMSHMSIRRIRGAVACGRAGMSTSRRPRVERRFAKRPASRRGAYRLTCQLEADIRAFIDKHNEDPKAFKWTESADDILAAVKRFRLRVEQDFCHELQIQATSCVSR